MDIRYVNSKGFYIDKWIQTLFIWVTRYRYMPTEILAKYILADFIFRFEKWDNVYYVRNFLRNVWYFCYIQFIQFNSDWVICATITNNSPNMLSLNINQIYDNDLTTTNCSSHNMTRLRGYSCMCENCLLIVYLICKQVSFQVYAQMTYQRKWGWKW